MKSDRFFVLLCAALIAGMAVTSCNKKDGASGTRGKASDAGGNLEEIVYWNVGVDEPDKTILEYAIEKYNSNPDRKYNVKNVPTMNDTYKEKLVIAMGSGQCPDVYTSWSGGPMIEYIKAGVAQPLDDLFQGSQAEQKIMDATVAQGTYKGQLYGLGMLNVSLSGIFYNTEIYEEYGLSIPKTVSELEKNCDVLVENGIIPFALANASKWTGSMYFMNLATRYGGLEPFIAAAEGKGSFEDESYLFAGEKIQEWVSKGYFPEGVNSLSEDDGQSRQLLYLETAAMNCMGSWFVGTMMSDSMDFYRKMDWFPFPAVDGSDADASIQIGTIGDTFLSFSCTGEKLAEAFKMADYYFDDEALAYMAQQGKIPPVKNIASMLEEPIVKKILSAALNASSTQLWYDQYLPPAVAEVHKDTSQELFGLLMSPQEANRKLQDAMQEYLNTHN